MVESGNIADAGAAGRLRAPGAKPGEPDLGSLVALAQRPDLDLRAVILRVQTDLFAAAPARDAETIRAYEALALGLLPTIRDGEAARIAQRLAPVADAPESVILALVLRGGESRQAVIAGAPFLSPSIAAALKHSGVDPAPLLARRADLTPAAIEALVARDDSKLDLTIASNHAANLPAAAREILLRRARLRPALATALLARPDLPPGDAAFLYVEASPQQRAVIRSGLERIAGFRRPLSFRATAQTRERLIEYAYQRDLGAFGTTLGAVLGYAATPDWRFQEPKRHDLLALALSAAGVPDEDCLRIFLVIDGAIARSVPIVFGLVELVRATPRATAMHLVESILGVEASAHRRGRHIPAEGPAAAHRHEPASRRPEIRSLREGRERA